MWKRLIGFAGLLIAAALIVHRCDDAAPMHAGGVPGAKQTAGDAPSTPGRQHLRRPTRSTEGSREGAGIPVPRQVQLRVVPDEDEEMALIRRETWSSLEQYKTRAQLTDDQFQLLLSDLADLAKLQEDSFDEVASLSGEEAQAFWRDQATELEDRTTEYLSPAQLTDLRENFSTFGLVAQVRRLRLLEEVPGDGP